MSSLLKNGLTAAVTAGKAFIPTDSTPIITKPMGMVKHLVRKELAKRAQEAKHKSNSQKNKVKNVVKPSYIYFLN